MNERNFEDRLQVRGSLSWYKPDWLGGNHEIKVGGDAFKVRADRQRLDRISLDPVALALTAQLQKLHRGGADIDSQERIGFFVEES